MFPTSTLLVIVTAALLPFAVSAGDIVKQEIDWSEHQYVPAGPDDVRSPCPGLNALANHGFLNHTGQSISVNDILQAGLDVYNVHPDVLQLAAKIGLTTSSLYDVMSLETIRLHDSIEHDASISRSDMALGDNFSFNETIYSTIASSNEGVDYYNTTSAGWTQKERLRIASEANPELKNTGKEFVIRSQESALYLAAMGDIAEGKAPKEFVDIWFREERLPLEEGWTVPANECNLTTVTVARRAIQKASQWNATEGQDSSITLIVAEDVDLVI